MMIQREPEEDATRQGGAEGAEKEDVTGLKQALTGEKEKAEKYLANWQRAEADLANYKRRSEQEKEEISQFANSALVLSLLSVLDDLERAFISMPPELAKAGWIDGIRLIERKLRTSLEIQGLSSLKVVGGPFDPRFHEAIRQDKGKEGIVIEEVQKGYKFHGRVIRPSKVVVGDGAEDEVEQENNGQDNSALG